MLKAAMGFVEDVSICWHTEAAPNSNVTMHHWAEGQGPTYNGKPNLKDVLL